MGCWWGGHAATPDIASPLVCLPHPWCHSGDEKKPKPMRLGDAVANKVIANETLAYFIGRTWLFFCRVGINPQRMRFRQHLQHEVRARGH